MMANLRLFRLSQALGGRKANVKFIPTTLPEPAYRTDKFMEPYSLSFPAEAI